MKSRTTRDERAMNSNGQKSNSRELVLEALEAQGKEGATIDEVVALIGADLNVGHPKMSIGAALSRLETDEYVICYRGRWYMKGHFYKPEPATNGKGVTIAPLVQKRTPKTISLHTKPRTYTDAVAVDLLIKERWTPIPFMVNMRVMIDPEVADWPCEKWFWTDVEIVRITHKDGRKTEERPAPRDIITIAAEE